MKKYNLTLRIELNIYPDDNVLYVIREIVDAMTRGISFIGALGLRVMTINVINLQHIDNEKS
jgi:hypothetical protein